MSRIYNVIDADGHILEPPDLWTKNIEAKFRDQAPRVIVDTDGRDRCLIEGHKVGHAVQGQARTGAINCTHDEVMKMRYIDGKKGGFDPHARIKDMDLDGIDAAFLYPSLGLLGGVIENPELAAAVCRTYNHWIAEYAGAYPDRLFGVAMLPMQSVEHAIQEIKYARNKIGLTAAFLRPNPYNDLLWNDPTYDPFWAVAQDLDVSIGFHEGTTTGGRHKPVGTERVDGAPARHICSHAMEMMVTSLNIIWGGVCERFPKLRFGFLECGGGWMLPWLDRMDRHYNRPQVHGNSDLKMMPSDYFRRQCWISFEPPERTIADTAEILGANKLLWATDYPHPDGFFPGAPKTISDKLPDAIRRQVLAQGAMDFYKLH